MESGILVHPVELSEAWIERAAALGIDIMGIHPEGGAGAAETLRVLLERCKTTEFRRLVDLAYERGMKVEYEFHAAGYLVPRELFECHPEYFRMNENGVRMADGNFCPSSEGAMSLAAERAAEAAKGLYRSSERYYFWMDDAKNKKCHCPKCRNTSASDQQLKVMERVLSALRADRPDAKLAYLAYYDTMEPPEGDIADGIFLEYAPIDKTKHADSPEAAEEIRMAKLLRERFGSRDAKILEYWLDNSLFSDWRKPPHKFAFTPETVEAMEADIRNYRDMGFEIMTTFACYLGSDYEELYGEADITPFACAVRNI